MILKYSPVRKHTRIFIVFYTFTWAVFFSQNTVSDHDDALLETFQNSKSISSTW